MKLAYRFALALLVGVLLVLATYSWVRVEREASLFDGDIRRDQRVLAHALRAAIRHTWKHADKRSALAVLRAADQEHDGVTIRWLDNTREAADTLRLPEASTQALASPTPQLVQITLQPEERGSLPQSPPVLASSHDALLVTFATLPDVDGGRGAIALFESLAPRSAYLRHSLRNTLIASSVIALVCALIALVLGVFVIGRPVRLLVRQAQRIGAGERPPPLVLAQRDELGTLARAMNLMAEKLDQAHERMATDAREKLEAVERLQHEKRLATLGRMASAVAHEVGTPLNVVSGHAKLLTQQRVTGQHALESARTIAEQCDRMTRMVRQLLDYTRRRSPRRIEADLRDIVTATVSMLRPVSEERGVNLELRLSNQSCKGVFDSSQLQQVISNLLVNAIQCSAPGSNVCASVTRAHTGSTGDSSLAWVECVVEDEGPGIPEADRERIFEPFFTTKPSGEGTGLGLSIAMELVRAHEGELRVEARSGGGSRFCVLLPLERVA